jgi:hypothetical protein
MLGRCDICGDPATHECDAPDCERKLCDAHTTWKLAEVAPPRTYCPEHVYLAEFPEIPGFVPEAQTSQPTLPQG